MGDKRRFDLFSDLVFRQFPKAAGFRIADVAGGKGFLRSALIKRGVQAPAITTWDKFRGMKRAPGFKRMWFDYTTAPNEYDLVLGMHPDEGTDHIIAFATMHHVPFVICPCCILPSAWEFYGEKNYRAWCNHLINLARRDEMRVEEFSLPMQGCSTVIVGRP